MGQIFCKDCCSDGESNKKNAVSWGEHTDFFTETTSLHSSPSSIADPKRSKRINNKKRNVALHAEYRVNHEMGILAPPLACCETIMEATDNVFAGQDLGVDTLHNGYGALGSTATIVSVSSNEKSSVNNNTTEVHAARKQEEHQYVKHEKHLKKMLS